MSQQQVTLDDATDISVNMTPNKSTPTPAKLKQLEDARVKALDVRRMKQKEKLELKLAELKRVLGGMSDDHIIKVTRYILDREEVLRQKQNKISLETNEALDRIATHLQEIRHALPTRTHPVYRSPSVASHTTSSSQKDRSPRRGTNSQHN